MSGYESFLEPYRIWLASTALHGFVNRVIWVWPALETLHYIGLSLLLGTVGLLDLRMLGMAKRMPLSAMHGLVPWGIAGFVINIVTGSMFLTGAPDQYLYNVAFQIKMMFIVLAGVNVAVFYLAVFRDVEALGPGQDAPLSARIIGGASLFFWIVVLCCGRLLTFYRPPFVR